MVNVLNVSRSGYYALRRHGQTVNPREQRQIERDEAIKQAFIDSKERSGARRIQVDLAELDMTPDIKTIRNSMIRQALYLRLHVNLRSPRTVSTISLWRQTCWSKILRQELRIKSGLAISRIYSLVRAGCT